MQKKRHNFGNQQAEQQGVVGIRVLLVDETLGGGRVERDHRKDLVVSRRASVMTADGTDGG